jgi:CRISPR/Cas system-associated endoribonuclease Cas2
MVLDHRLLDNLVAELMVLIDPRHDRLLIYPICAACRKKAVYLGLSQTDVRPGEELVFIV